jgi:low affinity Fe/Cu permease
MPRRKKDFIATFNSVFTKFAKAASRATGRPITFVIAVVIIVIWAMTGPIFNYSDTWQLVINTSTTIITFLMALQIKLDELIRAVGQAQIELIDLEEMDDDELDLIRKDYLKLAKKARRKLQKIEKGKKEQEK